MSHYKTAAKDKVPIVQKAAFGAGHLVNNLIARRTWNFYVLFTYSLWDGSFLGRFIGWAAKIF